MRKLVLSLLIASLFVGGYALWPIMTAFQIKQAVRNGDVATLERKVMWEPVRASLKASIAELTPAGSAGAQTAARPTGFWSSIKAMAAPMFAESFIDRYVTPEGVAQLQYVKRGGWRTFVGMAPNVQTGSASAAVSDALQGSETARSDDELNPITRFMQFYDRVVRAKFHALDHVEFEIADKSNPDRRFVSQFLLKDYEWKLASVRVVGAIF